MRKNLRETQKLILEALRPFDEAQATEILNSVLKRRQRQKPPKSKSPEGEDLRLRALPRLQTIEALGYGAARLFPG